LEIIKLNFKKVVFLTDIGKETKYLPPRRAPPKRWHSKKCGEYFRNTLSVVTSVRVRVRVSL